MWAPGTLVECVDDELREPNGSRLLAMGFIPPVKGRVYTVRWHGHFPWAPDKKAVYLREVVNPKMPSGKWRGFEFAYASDRFKPLSPSRIECFTKLLEKEPQNVR